MDGISHPDPLLAEIDTFLAEARMTPTAFGRDALGDPGFVFDLRGGRDCRRSTLSRAREQIGHFRLYGEFIRRPTPTTPELRETGGAVTANDFVNVTQSRDAANEATEGEAA